MSVTSKFLNTSFYEHFEYRISKTFANFAVLWRFAEFRGVASFGAAVTNNLKVFSAKIAFFTDPRMFSPSKVFCFTASCDWVKSLNCSVVFQNMPDIQTPNMHTISCELQQLFSELTLQIWLPQLRSCCHKNCLLMNIDILSASLSESVKFQKNYGLLLNRECVYSWTSEHYLVLLVFLQYEQ